MFQRMIDKSMAKSPWIFHINAGSCNGCDIELVSVLTPRYDAERLGFRLTGTPRQADIVVVSGPVTSQTKDRLVGLSFVSQHSAEFCTSSQTYRQHSLGLGIQGPCMTDLLLFQDSPQLCHHVMGSITLFLIYIQNPIDHDV